jgi:gliding motility-associated-like protein
LDACTIKILDSWGNVVYESLGYDNGWNGTIEGEELQQGVYYYILDCGDGSPQTGSITLIR